MVEQNLKETADTLGRIFVEPYDWVRTGYDFLTGEATGWDFLAFLPLLSGGITKYGDDIFELASDFKLSGFREGLMKLTAKSLDDFVDLQAHHVLPQKFEKEFTIAGIDINDPKYGSWVDPIDHAKWSYDYNKDWETFFRDNQDPSSELILAYAESLSVDYGFIINFSFP